MASYKEYLDAAYNAQTAQYDKQKAIQEEQYNQAKKTAADTLKETNRGLYQSYMQQRNPFGANAEQRGMGGSKMSEYGMNQAYATYLNGLGTARNTYNNSLNEANSTWQSYLNQDAANRAQAEYQRMTQLASVYADDTGSSGSSRRYYSSNSSGDGTQLTDGGTQLTSSPSSSGITNERQYYAQNRINTAKTTKKYTPNSTTNRLNNGKAYSTSKSKTNWG